MKYVVFAKVEQRLEKLAKYVIFAKAKQRLEQLVKSPHTASVGIYCPDMRVRVGVCVVR